MKHIIRDAIRSYQKWIKRSMAGLQSIGILSVQCSGVQCSARRRRSRIHHHKKRGVGVEPRKLQYGIAALVWSLNIGI